MLYGYETHTKKEEHLYDATATAFPLIDDASVPACSPGKRRVTNEDNTSVLHTSDVPTCFHALLSQDFLLTAL